MEKMFKLNQKNLPKNLVSKPTLCLTIENKKYIVEEDQKYIFEFKPGYELGDFNNPFSKCMVMELSLKNDVYECLMPINSL
ncbi:hypothetical protein [Gottfriedia acidiceleris]|uniref:hypothetical protein n=1 Tax=Gottfriedia acidiceleris TaxID=371036 RepID=UPI003D1C56DE